MATYETDETRAVERAGGLYLRADGTIEVGRGRAALRVGEWSRYGEPVEVVDRGVRYSSGTVSRGSYRLDGDRERRSGYLLSGSGSFGTPALRPSIVDRVGRYLLAAESIARAALSIGYEVARAEAAEDREAIRAGDEDRREAYRLRAEEEDPAPGATYPAGTVAVEVDAEGNLLAEVEEDGARRVVRVRPIAGGSDASETDPDLDAVRTVGDGRSLGAEDERIGGGR